MLKILIVDDTITYRSFLKSILSDCSEISLIETANNGKRAIEKMQSENYNLIILDVEMPEMDGHETVKEMKRLGVKSHVILVSSTSKAQSKKTLEALHLGVHDFIEKPNALINSSQDAASVFKEIIVSKVLQFLQKKETDKNTDELARKITSSAYEKINLTNISPKIIVIGCSTGGPVAIENLLTDFSNKNSPPILIAQHMPPIFTTRFAERISSICKLNVFEAKNNQDLRHGEIYIAPGDHHMEIEKNDSLGYKISLNQKEKECFVRPAADRLFYSASKHFQDKCLGFILTGMGSDGCQGSVDIKNSKGAIFIQNKETSVVWGMAGSVYRQNSYDEMGDLKRARSLLDKYHYIGSK